MEFLLFRILKDHLSKISIFAKTWVIKPTYRFRPANQMPESARLFHPKNIKGAKKSNQSALVINQSKNLCFGRARQK